MTQPTADLEQAGPMGRSWSERDEADEAVRPAGRFRIYLGAVAGVGKTWAMLDEGWRRHERGRDVVVGFVETHGRAHTAEQLRDLEVIPRRKVEYRGASFEEMDLEAVLARKPEIVLIDELAHTNVPGSGRNAKRFQDVLECLEAGIAVISTVNVQHLESIADAVETITGVAIRERVPDWVVRSADQLELVDSSPEQLRRRMLHGNIYPAEKVPAALSGFFRQENLTALRELALRYVADETEDQLLAFLASHHTPEVWETTERIMVAVTGAPGSGGVLRRAARIAARLKADLHAVHVTGDAERADEAKPLAEARQVALDVGAHWHTVGADDPARGLVSFAREHQVTQIVLGSSRRSRIQELTSGSVVSRVLRFAGEAGIDVHVIARREHPHRRGEPDPDA
ncbi:MAG: osmosensitive channel signal transduction histidine kinase, sensor subunit KdpD [Acidimicrobiaceae bacterium]|nr:osmosensitive channel signal transduction histidine kinase, sensor subunit KdpD [Acidimicrobiaceae bacterium]